MPTTPPVTAPTTRSPNGSPAIRSAACGPTSDRRRPVPDRGRHLPHRSPYQCRRRHPLPHRRRGRRMGRPRSAQPLADLPQIGGGPSLIEADTYRIEAHTNADDATRYRTDDEVAEWVARDPLSRLRTYLRSEAARP